MRDLRSVGGELNSVQRLSYMKNFLDKGSVMELEKFMQMSIDPDYETFWAKLDLHFEGSNKEELRRKFGNLKFRYQGKLTEAAWRE